MNNDIILYTIRNSFNLSHMCNSTLPRRRGSRPDGGARLYMQAVQHECNNLKNFDFFFFKIMENSSLKSHWKEVYRRHWRTNKRKKRSDFHNYINYYVTRTCSGNS